MKTPNVLSAAARAELDRTLDSLTMRALTETATLVVLAGYLPAAAIRNLILKRRQTK